jgi:hypothetical protein
MFLFGVKCDRNRGGDREQEGNPEHFHGHLTN